MPIRKKLLALLLAAVLVCTMSLTAFAREAPDTSRKGSIQLTIRQGGTAVPGGSFTLYQVGALQEEDGNYRFVLTEAFAGSKVSLEEVSSAQLANTLAAYAKDHKLAGTAKDVDKDGEIAFTGLELGLYLIVQTEASKGYEPINPFLVSLPMAEDGKWNYAVDARPKVGAYTPTKPDTPPTPPTPPTPDHPDTPTPPDNPDNPVSPGNPDNPVAPGHPDNPVAPGHPDNPVMSGLPQTGQLNWPVPVLAVSGVVLFAFGWALDRKYRTV